MRSARGEEWFFFRYKWNAQSSTCIIRRVLLVRLLETTVVTLHFQRLPGQIFTVLLSYFKVFEHPII